MLGRAASTSWNVVARLAALRWASSGRRVDAGRLEQVGVLRADAGSSRIRSTWLTHSRIELAADPGRLGEPVTAARLGARRLSQVLASIVDVPCRGQRSRAERRAPMSSSRSASRDPHELGGRPRLVARSFGPNRRPTRRPGSPNVGRAGRQGRLAGRLAAQQAHPRAAETPSVAAAPLAGAVGARTAPTSGRAPILACRRRSAAISARRPSASVLAWAIQPATVVLGRDPPDHVRAGRVDLLERRSPGWPRCAGRARPASRPRPPRAGPSTRSRRPSIRIRSTWLTHSRISLPLIPVASARLSRPLGRRALLEQLLGRRHAGGGQLLGLAGPIPSISSIRIAVPPRTGSAAADRGRSGPSGSGIVRDRPDRGRMVRSAPGRFNLRRSVRGRPAVAAGRRDRGPGVPRCDGGRLRPRPSRRSSSAARCSAARSSRTSGSRSACRCSTATGSSPGRPARARRRPSSSWPASCRKAGVPCFVADIKGDLTGLAAPGDGTNPKVIERCDEPRPGRSSRPAIRSSSCRSAASSGPRSGRPSTASGRSCSARSST